MFKKSFIFSSLLVFGLFSVSSTYALDLKLRCDSSIALKNLKALTRAYKQENNLIKKINIKKDGASSTETVSVPGISFIFEVAGVAAANQTCFNPYKITVIFKNPETPPAVSQFGLPGTYKILK